MNDTVGKAIDEWASNFKTSWKYLEKLGFKEAKNLGDCIFLSPFNYNYCQDAIDSLKEKIDIALFGDLKEFSKKTEYLRLDAEEYNKIMEKINGQ